MPGRGTAGDEQRAIPMEPRGESAKADFAMSGATLVAGRARSPTRGVGGAFWNTLLATVCSVALTLTLRHPVRCDTERRIAVHHRLYQSGEFARMTAVSVRTLRYYDKMGLLSPSCRTEAGYRLYSDSDLIRLQHIVALKFLGFSLDEIRVYLNGTPRTLSHALTQQKAMLHDWRRRLGRVINAIEGAEQQLETDQCDWTSLVQVIRAVQMEQDRSWTSTYFTEEQRKTMEELSATSYTERAREKLAARRDTMGGWTEEDQRRIDLRYANLDAGVKRVVAAGADPGSPEVQELAMEAIRLVEEFTGGDPEVTEGLNRWWEQFAALPAEKQPLPPRLTPEESDFLERAKAIVRQR